MNRLTLPAQLAILEPMSYPGGKAGAGVYQTIINLMPPHKVYIEPFLGGGAVMLAKRPADLNYGFDLSPDAVKQFRDRLSTDSTRGSRFDIAQGNGIDFLTNYDYNGDELVYCDPPYMRGTRRTSKDRYDFEMTDGDHKTLIGLLLELPCKVMLSGYWSKLYSLNLNDWNYISFRTMTRGGSMAQEFLWFNFPKPVALHDYSYLGRDYRERERIKRKKDRWKTRLAKMPALEKQALLAALTEVKH